MGLYAKESQTDKMAGAFRVFGAVLTWALENAVDTADSMKARGYGMKGRTNFGVFRFRTGDALLLGAIGLLSLILAVGICRGAFSYHYYPYLSRVQMGAEQTVYYLAGFLLMLMPAIIEIKENIRWKWLKSRI